MYTYKDASYTDDQIKKAAEQSNMTVKEYLKKIEGDKDPEPKIKDGDLLDPNFQQDAAADADAGVSTNDSITSEALRIYLRKIFLWSHQRLKRI